MKKSLLIILMLSLVLSACQTETPETTEVTQSEEAVQASDIAVGKADHLILRGDELFVVGEQVEQVDLGSQKTSEASLYPVEVPLNEGELESGHSVGLVSEDLSSVPGRVVKDKDQLIYADGLSIRVVNLLDGSSQELVLSPPEGITLDTLADEIMTMNGEFILISGAEDTHMFTLTGEYVKSFPLKATSASKDAQIFSYTYEDPTVLGFYLVEEDKPQLITLVDGGDQLMSEPYFYDGPHLLYLTEEQGLVVYNKLNVVELTASNVALHERASFEGATLHGAHPLLKFSDRFYYGDEENLNYYDQSFDEIRQAGEFIGLLQGDNLRVIHGEQYRDYRIEGSIKDFVIQGDTLVILYENGGEHFLKNETIDF